MAYSNVGDEYTTTPTATWGQQVNDNMAFLGAEKPAIKVSFNSQSVSNDTATALAESYAGSSALWSGSRLQIPNSAHAGLYIVSAAIEMQSSTTGYARRYVRLRVNGSDYVASRQGTRDLKGLFYTSLSTVVDLSSGDYVETVVLHQNGSTMNFYGSMSAVQVAPAP